MASPAEHRAPSTCAALLPASAAAALAAVGAALLLNLDRFEPGSMPLSFLGTAAACCPQVFNLGLLGGGLLLAAGGVCLLLHAGAAGGRRLEAVGLLALAASGLLLAAVGLLPMDVHGGAHDAAALGFYLLAPLGAAAAGAARRSAGCGRGAAVLAALSTPAALACLWAGVCSLAAAEAYAGLMLAASLACLYRVYTSTSSSRSSRRPSSGNSRTPSSSAST